MSNVFAVTLLLDCGHKIKVPAQPSRTIRAKFACPMNSGCGYRLDWVESTDQKGSVQGNPTMDLVKPDYPPTSQLAS